MRTLLIRSLHKDKVIKFFYFSSIREKLKGNTIVYCFFKNELEYTPNGSVEVMQFFRNNNNRIIFTAIGHTCMKSIYSIKSFYSEKIVKLLSQSRIPHKNEMQLFVDIQILG
jgi:hypothetical protein